MPAPFPSPGVPRGPWLRIWVLACAGNLAFFGALEAFWRHRGHEPAIQADVGLWCYHRERVEVAHRRTIALVGASRMQTGFVTEVFLEDHPGYEVVQLSVPGQGGFATLRDLAATETFRGLVLFDTDARSLQPVQLEGQQDLVDHYHQQWGPGAKASLLLSAALQERLTVVRPQLTGEQLVVRLAVTGRCPRPNYMKTLFSRRWIADYGRVDVDALVEARCRAFLDEMRAHPPAPGEVWRDVVRQLAGFARRIEVRGGKVVFVTFPMRGRIADLNDAYFPRAIYLDPLVAEVGTEVIDSAAMPGGEALRCPDGSHLDEPSAAAFTRWLGEELGRRGLLDEAGGGR